MALERVQLPVPDDTLVTDGKRVAEVCGLVTDEGHPDHGQYRLRDEQRSVDGDGELYYPIFTVKPADLVESWRVIVYEPEEARVA